MCGGVDPRPTIGTVISLLVCLLLVWFLIWGRP